MGIINFLKNTFKFERVKKTVLVETPQYYSNGPAPNTSKFFDKNDFPFGTIIWAKRYNNEEEMQNILEGHREGPYIVADVDEENDRLVCFYCTTTLPKYKSIFYRCLNVGDIGFNSFKSTYVCVSKSDFITKERFEKTNGCLSDTYQADLKKKIDIVCNEGFFVDYDFSKFKTPLSSGDIISYMNSLYLIISEDNDYYKCVEITDDFTIADKKDDKFIVGRIVYKIMYDSFDYISKKDTLKRYDIVSDRTFNLILKKMKNYCSSIGERPICRGALISMNDSLFYVYGEEGLNWLLTEIYKGFNEDLCNFNINGRSYYSNFKNNISVSKKEKMNINSFATEDEVDDIKLAKKSYLKSQSKKSLLAAKARIKTKAQKVKPQINVGSIVKEVTLDETLYLVVGRDKDTITTVVLEDAKNGVFNVNIFDASFLRLADRIYLDRNDIRFIISEYKISIQEESDTFDELSLKMN